MSSSSRTWARWTSCCAWERAGKDWLARNIEQVSKTVGDHAGYDIRSYHADGRDRFIKVKTTRYGRYTPFYISNLVLALPHDLFFFRR